MKLFLNKIIVENYNKTGPIKQLTEIDELMNSIEDKVKETVVISKDIMNSISIKDTLEPQIWEKEKLNPKVKAKLLEIANDFYNDLKLPKTVPIKDVIFTGSLANFNWSKFSDLDLHIVIDFSNLEGEQDFKEELFWAHKSVWNQDHDINVFEYPIEIYVQDSKAKLAATAVYSVKKDKWVLKPEHDNFKINKKVIKSKAESFVKCLKDIKNDYDDKNYQNVLNKTIKLKDKIKKYRTLGLDKDGEFSIENLVFKVLRRTPFLDIVDSLKSNAYDNLMSIDESILTKDEKTQLIIEANNKYATLRDYYMTLFKIAKAKELYGGDEYWENVQDGQWVGASIVNIFGRISKISTYTAPSGQVRANDLGMRGENPHYLEFKIMAGRGIDHGDEKTPNIQPARTRLSGVGSEEFEHEFTMQLPQGVELQNGETKIKFGLPKPGSPANDAHIKTYLIYGDTIVDFVKNNLKDKIGYVDGKGEEISKQAMANNPSLQQKKIKKDLEMELNRRVTDTELELFMKNGQKPKGKQVTSMDSDKAAEFQQRQADAIARREKALARRK